MQLAPRAVRSISGGVWSSMDVGIFGGSFGGHIRDYCGLASSATHVCQNCFRKWQNNLSTDLSTKYETANATRCKAKSQAPPASALLTGAGALPVATPTTPLNVRSGAKQTAPTCTGTKAPQLNLAESEQRRRFKRLNTKNSKLLADIDVVLEGYTKSLYEDDGSSSAADEDGDEDEVWFKVLRVCSIQIKNSYQ